MTNLGSFVVDLKYKESERECLNFVKLFESGFYEKQIFYNVNANFVVQCGNPQYQTPSALKETTIWGLQRGESLLMKSKADSLKHTKKGTVSLVKSGPQGAVGSQFLITLTDDPSLLASLDDKGVIVGEIVEGLDVLELFNKTVVDDDKRPLQDIVILHTYIIHDPFPDEKFSDLPSNGVQITDLRLLVDTEKNENSELNSKLLTLEMIGDIDSSIKPSEKVMFICKLNPVTKESDLHIIFQRFGEIEKVEIIRDKLTNKSLNYGFVEFKSKESCDALVLKMDNVLIDDRRIHVDFSQSISKEKRERTLANRNESYRTKREDKGIRYQDRDRYEGSSGGHRDYRGERRYGDDGRDDKNRYRDDRRGDTRRRDNHRGDRYRDDRYRDDRYRDNRYRDDRYRDNRPR